MEITDPTIHMTFEQQIPDFLADRLSNQGLEDFLEHYDECKSCQEELSVRYLIGEGLAKLETGEPFNLEKELSAYVQQERSRLHRRERFVQLAIGYEVLTLAVFAAAVVVSIVVGVW